MRIEVLPALLSLPDKEAASGWGEPEKVTILDILPGMTPEENYSPVLVYLDASNQLRHLPMFQCRVASLFQFTPATDPPPILNNGGGFRLRGGGRR